MSEQIPPELIPVTDIGQIKIGDVLLVCDDNSKHQYKVQDILQPTRYRDEEIILDTRKNTYFCTSLVLSGESWVKKVFIVERAPITLTLTRKQAQNIAEILADVLHYGPSKQLEVLKKQIEEKLK